MKTLARFELTFFENKDMLKLRPFDDDLSVLEECVHGALMDRSFYDEEDYSLVVVDGSEVDRLKAVNAELVKALEAADREVTIIQTRGNGWPTSAKEAAGRVREMFSEALAKTKESP